MTTTTAGAQEIVHWFQERMNGTFLITKEEDEDADRVRITVRKVSYWPGSAAADDYVEEDRIVLVGEGRIDGDNDRETDAAPLPRNSYEIPLGTDFRFEMQHENLKIVTGRAAYTISPLTSP